MKSEPNIGRSATCYNVWNIQQREDGVAKMLFSPFTRNTHQRHMPMSIFPSLECAKAKLAEGGVEHVVHQVCLQAIVEGGGGGDILERSKERLGAQHADKAANRARPEYFAFDTLRTSPAYITPESIHDIHTDPCGAKFAGKHSWDNPGWASKFPPRDPDEVIPPLALADANVSSSEEETLVPFETKRSNPARQRTRSPVRKSTAESALNPNTASSSTSGIQKSGPEQPTPAEDRRAAARARVITEGIQHMHSEPEPTEDNMLLLVDTVFSTFYNDADVLARPGREGQLQKYHLYKECDFVHDFDPTKGSVPAT